MPLITLLSDWGLDDPYLAEVKLRLYALMPDCRILDISHGLAKDDLIAAAFMMNNLYPVVPEGSIHLLGVQDIAGANCPHVVVRIGSQYFIALDNGFFEYFHWISGRQAEEVYEIDIWQDPDFDGNDVYTFPSRDLFPKVAAMLAEGRPLDQIGHSVSLSMKVLPMPMMKIREAKDSNGNRIGCRIYGQILYVDHFGNVCTNIRKSDYDCWIKQFPFTGITIGSKRLKKPPVKAYRDVGEGALLSLFLKNGFLEVSICGGNAAQLLGLRKESTVTVDFGSLYD